LYQYLSKIICNFLYL